MGDPGHVKQKYLRSEVPDGQVHVLRATQARKEHVHMDLSAPEQHGDQEERSRGLTSG